MNIDRSFRRRLTLITLGALALRVGATLLTKGWAPASLADQGDAFYYSGVANTMAAGLWFVKPFTGLPAADHPPLTVLVLTPASWIFGSTLAQRLTMVLVGTGTVALIGVLGRRLGRRLGGDRVGDGVGLVAAGIAALNPNLWINDTLVMSESLCALFVVLLVGVGYRLRDRPTRASAILAGAVLGLAMLTRPELGWFFPVMIVPILIGARGLSGARRIALVAAAALVALLVVAPWAAWNATRFDNVVLLSNNTGATLVGANCPATYFGDEIGAWDPTCGSACDRATDDASVNASRSTSAGLRYARRHLGRLPLVVFAREGRMLGWWGPAAEVAATGAEGRPHLASWAGYLAFWVLLPFAGAGAVRLHRRGVSLTPFVACVVTSVATAALFYGVPRLRLPIDVATCLLAAAAIGPVLASRGSPTSRSRPFTPTDAPGRSRHDQPDRPGPGTGARAADASDPMRQPGRSTGYGG